MSTGSKKKRRIDRVSSLELPPGVFGNLVAHLRRGHVLVRLAMCGITAMLLWAITRGWTAPLPYHLGDVPRRDIVARTQFEREDPEATRKARDTARSLAIATYDNDPARLDQVRAKIENDVTEIVAAKSLKDADKLWSTFRLPLAQGTPKPTPQEREERYRKFHDALAADGALDKFKSALDEIFAPILDKGLLDKLPPEHDANKETISVHLVGTDNKFPRNVPISDVLTENVASQLQKGLTAKMVSPDVADRVFARLKSELPAATTLKLNVDATRQEQKAKVAEVKTQTEVIPAGTILAHAQDEQGNRVPIDDVAIDKLRLEYQTELAHQPYSSKLTHSLSVLGLYVALFVLCGFYIQHRDPRIIDDLSRLATLLQPRRRHGYTGGAYSQRLAGRNRAADVVRHDRRDCVRAGNRTAAFGIGHADYSRGVRARIGGCDRAVGRNGRCHFAAWAAYAAAASCCGSVSGRPGSRH